MADAEGKNGFKLKEQDGPQHGGAGPELRADPADQPEQVRHDVLRDRDEHGQRGEDHGVPESAARGALLHSRTRSLSAVMVL